MGIHPNIDSRESKIIENNYRDIDYDKLECGTYYGKIKIWFLLLLLVVVLLFSKKLGITNIILLIVFVVLFEILLNLLTKFKQNYLDYERSYNFISGIQIVINVIMIVFILYLVLFKGK
jgi:hypothetical protein